MKPYFKDTIKESKPTLVIFIHAALQNAVDLKYLEEGIKTKYGDKLNLARVDVSYNRPLIDEFKINAYPTWILFEKGEELMRESGEKNISELSDMIDRTI